MVATEEAPAATVRRSPWPGGAALGLLFVALAALMTLPLGAVGRSVPGDNGDTLLVLWAMDWVIDHASSWGALWRGQMFQPHDLTLAYSEALLPQSLVFAVVRAVVPGSDALAANLVLLAFVTASLWWTYLLFRRLAGDGWAAVVGSVAWNFSAARLGHIWHFHLMTGGALIPLVVLTTLRLLDRPSLGRGVALGASLAALVLAASYYGLMMALFVALAVLAVVLRDRGRRLGELIGPLLAAAALVALVVGPVWLQYARLQRDPHFRRTPAPEFSAEARDLLAPAGTTRFLTDVPVLERFPPRNVERSLFVGVVVLVFAPIGAVAVVRNRPPSRRRFEVGLVVGLGALMLLLSAGDRGWLLGVDLPGPYRALRAVVPPFNGVRAPSRFGIVFALALSLLAAIGLATVGRRLSGRVRTAVAALVLALLLVESSVKIPAVDLPDSAAWTAVNHALADRPAGLTVELPVMTTAQGVAAAYVEGPRQYLARIDGHPRVNGYSGFEPPELGAWAALLNTFPGDDAVGLLSELGVRYVVVRTDIVGTFPPGLGERFAADQPPLAIAPADIATLATTRPDIVASVERHGEAWLIELVDVDRA